MSTNPYATPSDPSGGKVKSYHHYEFRSTRGLVTALTITFSLLAILSIVAVAASLGIDFLTSGLDSEFESELDESSVMMLQTLGWSLILTAGLYALIYIVNVILFCTWTNRTNTNARALGSEDMEFTPNWAVGWYFVPIANLFKPYQAMKEIYCASNPNAGPNEWDHHPVPSYFGWWWATWIAANVLGRLENRMADELGEMAPVVSLLAGLSVLTSAFLAVRVIRTVQARQEEKLKRRSASTPDPSAHGFREAGFQ